MRDHLQDALDVDRAVAVELATLVLSVCMFMSAPSSAQNRVPKLKRKFSVLSQYFLIDREGVVYTDRAERRYPLNADAGGDAHQLAVQDV